MQGDDLDTVNELVTCDTRTPPRPSWASLPTSNRFSTPSSPRTVGGRSGSLDKGVASTQASILGSSRAGWSGRSRGSVVNSSGRAWLGSYVQAFALGAEQAEHFGGAWPGGAEPVGGAGVELGDLPGGEDHVVVAEEQAQPAGQDVQPVVALVRALLALEGFRAYGDKAAAATRSVGPGCPPTHTRPGSGRGQGRPVRTVTGTSSTRLPAAS